jgi:hypothetical protein
MKERPLPPSLQNKKRRWMPSKPNGAFWSVAFSVFIGIFGYLVCLLLDTDMIPESLCDQRTCSLRISSALHTHDT